MIIVKKIVGTYAKKFSEICKNFEKLSVTMKPVHERETSKKHELHSMVVDNGKPYTAEMTDRNLFFALDKTLKRIESSINR